MKRNLRLFEALLIISAVYILFLPFWKSYDPYQNTPRNCTGFGVNIVICPEDRYTAYERMDSMVDYAYWWDVSPITGDIITQKDNRTLDIQGFVRDILIFFVLPLLAIIDVVWRYIYSKKQNVRMLVLISPSGFILLLYLAYAFSLMHFTSAELLEYWREAILSGIFT